MENPVAALDELGDQRGVTNTTLEELNLTSLPRPGKIGGGIARAEVVEHDDFGSARAECLSDVGANESGSACDKGFNVQG
jgi:hypothetical protein